MISAWMPTPARVHSGITAARLRWNTSARTTAIGTRSNPNGLLRVANATVTAPTAIGTGRCGFHSRTAKATKNMDHCRFAIAPKVSCPTGHAATSKAGMTLSHGRWMWAWEAR